MAINKVVYGNTSLIDLTNDSVSSETLLAGETAHDRSGAQITGAMVVTDAEEIDYEDYQELTPEEQADGSIRFIPDYPGIGGVFLFQTVEGMNAAIAGGLVPNNAICVVEEDTPYVVNAEDVNYDNTESGLSANKLQGAVDELNSNKLEMVKSYNKTLSVTANTQVTIDLSTEIPNGMKISMANISSAFYGSSNVTDWNIKYQYGSKSISVIPSVTSTSYTINIKYILQPTT